LSESEKEPIPNSEAPSWVDFKPPILQTPFANGRNFDVGSTLPPAEPKPPTVEEAPVVPVPTVTEAPLSSPPPVSADPQPAAVAEKHSSGVPKFLLWLVGLVVAGALVGGGAYLYYVNVWLPSNTASPSPTSSSENLAILDEAQGPPTWEGNYANTLLASERGGLEFLVTDPDISQTVNKIQQVLAEATPAAQPQGARTTDLTSLKVKIAHVEVHLANQTVVATSTDPTATKSANKVIDRWETLRLNENATVDLLALRSQGGSLSSLGVTYLTAGHYTEIRLFITQATGVTTDGQKVVVDLPGKNGIVKIVKSFDINATNTSRLLIDFDAPSSVVKSGETYRMLPVIGKVTWNGQEI
jgi:hypothetical protein